MQLKYLETDNCDLSKENEYLRAEVRMISDKFKSFCDEKESLL